jgi:hypothetical protein
VGTPSGSCVVCGGTVAAVDFEKGDAIRLLGKVYCGTCLREKVARSKSGDSMPDFRTPPPAPPKNF